MARQFGESTPPDEAQIARDRKHYSTPGGSPLSKRDIREGRNLRNALELLQRFATTRQPGHPRPSDDITPATKRLMGGIFALPPYYFRLRLGPNFTVLTHHANERQRQVASAGDFAGSIVAAHNIVLGANPLEPTFHVSTLEPDLRQASDVVIGVPAEAILQHVALLSMKYGIPGEIIDPAELLTRPGRPLRS